LAVAAGLGCILFSNADAMILPELMAVICEGGRWLVRGENVLYYYYGKPTSHRELITLDPA
jgi:hypothetical protein